MLSLSKHEGRRDALTAVLVMTGALIAVSYSSVFIRLADAPPLVVAAVRMTVAAAVLLGLALWRERAALAAVDRRQAGQVLLAGIFLAAHFAAWTTSLYHTSIANSVLLVNLSPVWLAVWATVSGAGAPGRLTWASVGLAVAGSLVIGGASAELGGHTSLHGDGLALLGGLALAAYLLVASRARQRLPLATYAGLTYTIAALILVAAALAAGQGFADLSWPTWQALLALALVSQVLGHTGYNWALRTVDPAFVAVVLLGEPVLAALFGWLWYGEAVGPATLAGGALVLAAIWLGARAQAGRKA